jgi:hypothetical protein
MTVRGFQVACVVPPLGAELWVIEMVARELPALRGEGKNKRCDFTPHE